MESISFAYTIETPKGKGFLQFFKIILLTLQFIAHRIEQPKIAREKTRSAFND